MPAPVLCSFVGGAGHLGPQLPVLRALRRRGHPVAVSGRQSALVDVPSGLFGEVMARPDRRAVTRDRIEELPPVDVEHELAVVGTYFARAAAVESSTAAAAAIERLRPGLVVCDEMDFGAVVAAEAAGVPVVVVGVTASGAVIRSEIVREPLGELRASFGLDPGGVRLAGDLFVSPFPPELRDPAFPLPAASVSIRPHTFSPRRHRPPRPLVYATLGTEFNTECGDLFERLLAGFAGVGVDVLLTVGRDLDPARFGPQPEHVRVERYVDIVGVLPQCALVVSHGGSGTVVAALAAGVPQLVVPMGADQPFNADRLVALGLGQRLDSVTASPADVAGAVVDLLDDSGAAARAAEAAARFATLPTAEDAVADIVRLI